MRRSESSKMEWPPKSGRQQEFSEVDRADWFSLGDARKRILKGQVGFLDRLIARFRSLLDIRRRYAVGRDRQVLR